MEERKQLREAGWERVLNPPLVSNQWIWRHPQWFVQLESEAIHIMNVERMLNAESAEPPVKKHLSIFKKIFG